MSEVRGKSKYKDVEERLVAILKDGRGLRNKKCQNERDSPVVIIGRSRRSPKPTNNQRGWKCKNLDPCHITPHRNWIRLRSLIQTEADE